MELCVGYDLLLQIIVADTTNAFIMEVAILYLERTSELNFRTYSRKSKEQSSEC